MLLQIDQSIYDFNASGEYIAMAFEISEMAKQAVLPIASAIIGIVIVLELLKVVFAEGQISWLKIFKLLIFFFAFKEYNNLTQGVIDLIQGIIDSFKNANQGYGYVAHGQILVDGEKRDIYRSTSLEIQTEFFMVSLFKMIMKMFQNIVQVLLIAMGPFAIMFSFIPGQDNIFTGWIRNLVHVLLWSVSFMILDMITTAVNLRIIVLASEEFSFYNMGTWLKNYGEAYLIKIILSLGYLMTPTLTSKYFGQSASGSFGKQMLATAGGVVAGAKLASGSITNAVQKGQSGGSSAAAPTPGAGSSQNTKVGGFGAMAGSGGAAGASGAAAAAGPIGFAVAAVSKATKMGASAVKNGFNSVNKTEN
jgi:hypothetical protein